MPKTLLLSILIFCSVFSFSIAQKVSDTLPESTLAYLHISDFHRIYDLSAKLSFGERQAEVEGRVKGILSKLVKGNNLDQMGFSEDFILRTLTSVDSLHVAFTGLDPQTGAPQLVLAMKLTDAAHYKTILEDQRYLGGMVMPDSSAGVTVYNFMGAPVAVQMAIYKSHLIITNHTEWLGGLVTSGSFSISPNLTNSANYRKFSSMQRSGHFMTLYADVTQAMALMEAFGMTAAPDFQAANMILELNKLEAIGIQSALDNIAASTSFLVTMKADHKMYQTFRVAPSSRNIAHVLPSEVLFAASSSLGDASAYFNRVMDFADDIATKMGAPKSPRAELAQAEAQLGFTLAEMFSNVGSEMCFFALPIDGMDVNNFDPTMLTEVFGLVTHVKDQAAAQAFADKMFSSPMIAQNLSPENWTQQDYNGITIHTNVPPGAPAGLNYAFLNHVSGGTYVVVSASSTVITKCKDALDSGESLATSAGYKNAFELMNMPNSREFYMDFNSVMALLSTMPEMAPIMGMFGEMNTDAQQFGVVTIENADSFLILSVQKNRPQDFADVFLQYLEMAEMMIPGAEDHNEDRDFDGSTSRPTKNK